MIIIISTLILCLCDIHKFVNISISLESFVDFPFVFVYLADRHFEPINKKKFICLESFIDICFVSQVRAYQLCEPSNINTKIYIIKKNLNQMS